MSQHTSQKPLKKFLVVVRTNCEYRLNLEIEAENEDAANEAGLAQAEAHPVEEWTKSWAPNEAEVETELD